MITKVVNKVTRRGCAGSLDFEIIWHCVKCPNTYFFQVLIFPYSNCLQRPKILRFINKSVFSPNMRKRARKTSAFKSFLRNVMLFLNCNIFVTFYCFQNMFGLSGGLHGPLCYGAIKNACTYFHGYPTSS